MRKHISLLAGISLLWGSGWIVASTLAQLAAPFAASALVFALAAFLLAPVRSRLQPQRFRTNFLLGATLFAAPAALLLLAGRQNIGGWTPLLYSLLPLLLAFAGEGWIPAMIVAPGAVLTLLNGTVPFTPAKLVWTTPVLAAVGLQAWTLRYAAVHLPGRAWPRALAIQLALAAVLLGGASLLLDPQPRLSLPTLSSFAALAVSALLGTAIPYAGLFFLLSERRLRPEQIAVSQWMQTLFVVAESAILVRAHPPSAVYAAGAVLLVCAGLVLSRNDAFSY